MRTHFKQAPTFTEMRFCHFGFSVLLPWAAMDN